MSYRVGIDTGGTFTDLVVLNEETGTISTVKRPSTPLDPSRAVIDALERAGVNPADITSIVLGTTITTNALLQRTGARVFYVTTRGFEDIPHLQRADKRDPYDLQSEKPRPFVSRRDCLGIAERTDHTGRVLTDLEADALVGLGDAIEQRLVDGARTGLSPDATVDSGARTDVAVAVNLLFSFANPAHEQVLRDYLTQRFPQIPISLSSKVAPMWREYERASTTILDAYTKPLVGRFAHGLDEKLRAQGHVAPLALMKSNGGQVLASAAVEQPAQLMLSGLAGGVIAGSSFGDLVGCKNVITFDMGGTSTDVGVVTEGQLAYTTEYQLDFGIPVAVPSLDLITIGAGGGSIAWIDKGGLLRVGPHSASADPGPVCYGRGGTAPTVTDANLALGRLDPSYFLGGEMALELQAARDAIADLGAGIGLETEATARAIIAIANENMANAIRVLTIERGLDPRDFALVAFGGAGPMHAAEIAAMLGIGEVIVPVHPGLTSALGTLLAAPRVDRHQTFVRRGAELEVESLDAMLRRLDSDARADLLAEGWAREPLVERTIAMRYAGQDYEQSIQVPAGPLSTDVVRELYEAFHTQHEQSYGYRIADATIEITACAVTALGNGIQPILSAPQDQGRATPRGRRMVATDATVLSECPIFSRHDLPAGEIIHGPAVIEEADSTLLLLPHHTAEVHPTGTLVVRSHATTGVVGHSLDPVTLSIVNNALVNICREMGTAMVRTAYSPIFNESRDFSCALFDRQGQMLAQGEYCPAQLGAVVHTVRSLLDEWGPERFEPGDVVIHNDPYRGGCHMPEHLMLKPIYQGTELVAFAAIIAHVAEIGGMVVGSFASTATEIFQEGLRLPPVKLMRRDEYVHEVWDIVLANHRTPRHTWGDFHAMLGALKVAEGRFQALCNHYGAAFLLQAGAALLDYAERWMRAEIRALPDGMYEFEDALEDDGVGSGPIKMHVRVTVRGDTLVADYSASADQVRGPVNATYGVTLSATYNAIYQLVDTTIPRNAGCYRPITVIARPGCCLNVQFPAPCVGGNTETQPRIVFLILGALANAVPERVSACEGCTACNFLIGGIHPDTGEYYAHYHFEASGWGGRATKDGTSCQNHVIGNCRITPLEVFETRFPLLVLSYGLRTDSGGPGRFRGGLGSRRVLRVVAPEMRVSMLMDHALIGAWGLFGGAPGETASVKVKRAGTSEFRPFPEVFGTISPSKFADVHLFVGDEICLESAGGGGYGDPQSREPKLVLDDLAEGLISPSVAHDVYGMTDASVAG